MKVGELTIEMAANIARLRQDMNNAQNTVKGTMRTINRSVSDAKRFLAGLGIGLSAIQFTSIIKGAIDAQDNLAKLSQKTGLAVESLAGLDFAASQSGTSLDVTSKGIRTFSRIVADSSGALNKNSEILRAMGVDLEALKSKTPEEQFFVLADAVQRLGEQDRAVAVTSLLGDRMADLVPLLSGGSDRLRDLVAEGQRYNPVTAESAARAEIFNDNLDRLSRSSGVLAQELSIGLVIALSEVTDEMAKAAEQGGVLDGIIAGVAKAAESLFTSNGFLKLVEFSGPLGSVLAGRVRDQKFDEFIKNRKGILELKNNVSELGQELEEASPAAATLAQRIAEIDKKFDKTSRSAKTLTKAEVEQEREAESLKRDIEKLTRAYDPLIERNERLARLLKKREAGLSESIFEAEATKAINDYIDATSGVIAKTEDIVDVTRSTTTEMDQLWIQSGRNIQSTLADSIFNFFDNGLKGMLKNVISTVGRIGSEFAALSLARGVGLGTLFAGGAAGASASGGGVDALSLASTGINAASLFNSGFGATSLIGGGLSRAGTFFGSGSLTAFGEAFAGDAIAGFAGAAGGIGASLGAAAGPAIVLFAADQIGRLLAGDKSTGTFVDKVPVIGGFASALFGLGPAKFRQQFLGGNVSEEGFQDGFVTDVFRRKGGVFRGNKHSQQDAANADEILSLFDDSIKAFFGSTRALAENLNLDAQALDNLTLNVAIQSEKKKVISQEQISAEMARLSDSIVGSVLPNVADFSKSGETAATTLARISNQTSALTSVLTNFGQASDVARETVLGLSFNARDDLVNAFGGIQSLSAKTQFFFEQAFSDAEKLAFATDDLSRSLTDLGVPVDVTKEGFINLIRALDVTTLEGAETANSLLEIFPAFIAVRNATDDLAQSTGILIEREKSLSELRSDLVSTFTTEQNELQGVIDRFKGFSDSIRDFKDSLSLGQLSPLTPGQRLDESRTQFNRVRALAAQGDENALRSLPSAAQDFLKASQTFNASSATFTSDFNFVQSVLDSVGASALNEADLASQQLSELETQVSQLTNIDNSVNSVEQAIKNLTVAVLTGQGNTAIGGQEIRDFTSNFTGTTQELVNAAVKNGVSGPQFSDATGASFAEVARATGGLSVTDELIAQAVNDNLDRPFEIYRLAKEHGITFDRLASASILNKQQIEDFARQNKLEALERGTDFVPRTGVALLHRGESVSPSTMPQEIKLLRKEISELRKEQNRQTQALINATVDAANSNADKIVNANKESDQLINWRDRSAVGSN